MNTFYSLIIFFIYLTSSIYAQTIFVTDDNQLRSAVNSAQPGDTIIVRDGSFDTDGSITIRNHGSEGKPIVIMSETLSGVEFINESYFDFRKCSYFVLSGFVFSSVNVTAVKLQASHHIRLTNNIFRIKESESLKWIVVGGIWDDAYAYSHDNRIDHNVFEGKSYPGNYITIDGSSEPTYKVSQRDTIDHNYFYNNNPRAENEKESIRIGWSELSASSGYTVVEYNLFEECNGDPEIISVKTCDNIIRYNTFRRSKGTLSLRHGNRSYVYGNFFLGEGIEGTGGIRVYGDDHKIYNNYFEGLTGTRWDAPITLTNGDYDGGTNYSKHFRINRAVIVFNTIVNNRNGIEIGFTNNGKYSKPPRDVVFANNIVTGNENNLVEIITSPVNMMWNNNILFADNGSSVGFDFNPDQAAISDPFLWSDGEIYRQSDSSISIDSAEGDWSFIVEDFEGQDRTERFDIGADEFSSLPITNKPLTIDDVGPVSDSVQTIVYDTDYTIQKDFMLYQNYPNPFNPNTIIKYKIPITDMNPGEGLSVTLNIYNLLGEEVYKYMNRNPKPGTHEYLFNAAKLPSGIYLYKLSFGNTISKKMILVK